MTFITDTLQLTLRNIRITIRIPIWVFVMLVQPIVWLTLYGQLFRRVVEIPGFESASYIQFLTPGVVIMTAFFGAAWSGMGLIEELNDGVIDRFLSTPINRSSIIAARVLHSSLTVVIQSVIILIVGLALGARVDGGIGGVLAILALSGLLGAGFAALSSGAALMMRRDESLIALINFFGLPLIFISSAFMASDLMPGWLRTLAQGNPVNWAVVAARNAMTGQDWSTIWLNIIMLTVFVVIATGFSTQAFRAYRRAA